MFWARLMRVETKFWGAVSTLLAVRKENTQRASWSALRDFCAFLGVKPGEHGAGEKLRTATYQTGAEYIEHLQKLGRADATITARIMTLKGIFDRLISADVLQTNPFARCKEYGLSRRPRQVRPTKVLTAQDVQSLLDIPNPKTNEGKRDLAILALLFGAALRRSEISNLRIQDIEQVESNKVLLKIRGAKGGGDELCLIAPWAAELVLVWKNRRKAVGAAGNDPLIISTQNRKGGLSPMQINRIFKKLAHEAGIEYRISSHSGRATAITELLKSGAELLSIRRFSRHKSYSALESYDKRSALEKDTIADKLIYDA